MDNYINFINNLRAGLADIDRQANQFLNEAGQNMSNTWNIGMNAVAAPFRAIGQTVGNGMQTVGNEMGNAMNQLVQNVGQPIANKQVEIVNALNQAMPTNSQPANNQTQNAGNVQNYYYRDPVINGFVDTLRWVMNPLRGITGWTPLDMIADTVSDSMYGTFGKKYDQPTKEEEKTTTEEKTTVEESTPTTESAANPEENAVYYTYKPGDTFGQVIKDLGLGTAKGLWGTDGDVEYYTQQLYDQGVLDERGNIPIGTTIKLYRRNAPENQTTAKTVVQDATYPDLQNVTTVTPWRV